jgi:hypothetical protein
MASEASGYVREQLARAMPLLIAAAVQEIYEVSLLCLLCRRAIPAQAPSARRFEQRTRMPSTLHPGETPR